MRKATFADFVGMTSALTLDDASRIRVSQQELVISRTVALKRDGVHFVQ